MQLIQTAPFKRDYKKLPPSIQKRTDEKLRLLVQNISYPSLRVKRVQKYKGIFDGSITKDYRPLDLEKMTGGRVICIK